MSHVLEPCTPYRLPAWTSCLHRHSRRSRELGNHGALWWTIPWAWPLCGANAAHGAPCCQIPGDPAQWMLSRGASLCVSLRLTHFSLVWPFFGMEETQVMALSWLCFLPAPLQGCHGCPCQGHKRSDKRTLKYPWSPGWDDTFSASILS